METPKFNNIPNDSIRIKYNRNAGGNMSLDAWLSRSVAVVGVVFASSKANGMQVLVTKRSMSMLDEKGKHGVPCGYLDYNETCYDAMLREVYEETSLYIPQYHNQLMFNNNQKPFTIHDRPTDNRQNVSLLYITVLDFDEDLDSFPQYVEKYQDKETDKVEWMKLIDFYNQYDSEYAWAFKHNETIKEALKFFNNNYNK